YAGATGITIVEESTQAHCNHWPISSYYRSFHCIPDTRLPNLARVYNVGVCVLARSQRALFKELFEKWRDEVRPRFTHDELRDRNIFYRQEADGPFLSYELQAQNKISPLPAKFNFFLPAWLQKNRVRRLPFLLQAKVAQKLSGKLPRTLLRALTAPA